MVIQTPIKKPPVSAGVKIFQKSKIFQKGKIIIIIIIIIIRNIIASESYVVIEMINHIISECCNLAQRKYKTRHDGVGKVISKELCKKLKFYDTSKWYKHKSESVLVHKTYKILWGSEIQTDHLIPAKRPDLVIINKKKKKKTCRIVNFAVPTDHMVKKRKNREKYLDLTRELIKL